MSEIKYDFERPEFVDNLPGWQKVDAVVSGRKIRNYLRKLRSYSHHGQGSVDPEEYLDVTSEDAARQSQYEENAIFYNITGHTLRGLVGTGFRKPATFEPTPELEYMLKNVDGEGNGINQQARGTLSEVTKKGRVGLFTDFPEVDRELSRADRDLYFATIHTINAERVINWRVRNFGSVAKLALVVIRGTHEVEDEEGIEVRTQESLLFLRLDAEGKYYTEKFLKQKRGKDGKQTWISQGIKYPTDASGNKLNEIPFTFVGSENNDAEVDDSPLLPLAEINIGHFRNSADFEDSVFYAGQSQPWMSNIDEEHLRMLQKYDIRVGSRFMMPVPEGGTFGFATPDANPVVRQAMLDKVELMIGLGAKFVLPRTVARTATEAEQEADAQTSMLSTIVGNVADAYTRCVRWASLFMGSNPVEYILDNDFTDLGSSPEMLAKWVESFIKGAVPESEYIAWMQRQGYFDPTKTPEDLSDELAQTSTQPPPDSVGDLPGAGGADS